MKIAAIISGIILLISVVVFLIIFTKKFRNYNKCDFSFLNMFPCELFDRNLGTILSKIFFGLLSATTIAIGVIFISDVSLIGFNGDVKYLSIIALCITCVFDVLFFMLNVIPSIFLKEHSIVFSLYSMFTFLYNGIISVILFLMYKYILEIQYLIAFCIFAFITVVVAINLLNPKLKDWFWLEKNIENGKISYSRPKVYLLAAYEWLLFFTQIISYIILVIFIAII